MLYRCLAEQKCDVKEALRDKCFVINNVQYEMSELKKHIHVLLRVLTSEDDENIDTNNYLNHNSPSPSNSTTASSAELDQRVRVTRTLEENFKKELRKVKELERQVKELDRDRDDLIEKNSFIEEENNIQREQIALLEETVRDLEDVAANAVVQAEDTATQTELSGAELEALVNENIAEIECLVKKYAELQQLNQVLAGKYTESRRALVALQGDFDERGKLMSELENELNGLKLLDRSEESRFHQDHHWMISTVVGEDGEQDEDEEGDYLQQLWTPRVQSSRTPRVLIAASAFLSPNSCSRSSSSTSSADFEEDDSGVSLTDDAAEAATKKVRKDINLVAIL